MKFIICLLFSTMLFAQNTTNTGGGGNEASNEKKDDKYKKYKQYCTKTQEDIKKLEGQIFDKYKKDVEGAKDVFDIIKYYYTLYSIEKIAIEGDTSINIRKIPCNCQDANSDFEKLHNLYNGPLMLSSLESSKEEIVAETHKDCILSNEQYNIDEKLEELISMERWLKKNGKK